MKKIIALLIFLHSTLPFWGQSGIVIEQGGAAGMQGFSVNGNTGTPFEINNAETLTITGFNGIGVNVAAGDIVQITLTAGLNNLSDVTLSSVQLNDVLKWNGSAWVNSPIGAGMNSFTISGNTGVNQLINDGNVVKIVGVNTITTTGQNTDSLLISWSAAMEDLNNVVDKAPTLGQILKWNGSAWEATNETQYMGNFIVTGDFGTLETITGGETLTLTGNNGIKTTGVVGNYVVIQLDATLSQINDVSLSGISTGQVLKWNGTNWTNDNDLGMTSFSVGGNSGVNQSITQGNTLLITGNNGITTTASATDQLTISWSATLNDLSNVNAPSPSAGQVLQWSGSAWVPANVSGGSLSFLVAGNGGTNQTITEGNTLSILGSGAITTTASATDQLTISWSATLNDLSNVNAPTPTSGDFLRYSIVNGWQNESVTIGSMSSFTLAGDGGVSQSITQGNTLSIWGGEGITTTANATDIISVSMNINELTTDNAPLTTDFLVFYDVSTGTHDKVQIGSLPISGFTSFTVGGNSGTVETITNGETLNIFGGTGLTSVGSASNSITLNMNISSLASDANPSPTDYFLFYDVSTATHETVTFSNAVRFTLSGDGGTPQTINAQENISVLGGVGITTNAATTNVLGIDLNINELTTDNAPLTTDFLVFYDVSTGTHDKVQIGSLPISGGSSTNIYNTSGSLTGSRSLSGSDFYSLTFSDVTTFTVSGGNGIKLSSASSFILELPGGQGGGVGSLVQLVGDDPMEIRYTPYRFVTTGTPSNGQTFVWNSTTSRFEFGSAGGGGCYRVTPGITFRDDGVDVTSSTFSSEAFVVPAELAGCVLKRTTFRALTCTTCNANPALTLNGANFSGVTLNSTNAVSTTHSVALNSGDMLRANVGTVTGTLRGLFVTFTIECGCS